MKKPKKDTTKNYVVWVGGVEVNDFYLSKEDAEDLRDEYLDEGYDDACIERHNINKKNQKNEYNRN